ncbi:hypothetical protein [Neobacillus niacini]|uniref:hypothetical protein n=1 Tax=Neobacillus niacini TaxID=86668 RepID=UPI001C8E4EC8|nr:hypothetical protein [Neobacillus niacini]MBY0146352.1 hypothetical protein [Neobacillus niacini]
MSVKMGSYKLKGRQIIIWMLFIITAFLLGNFIVSASDTYYSNYTPAKNAAITVSNTKISVYIKSVNELNSSSAMLKLNGQQVSATFTAKSYTGGKEGTISFNAANLKDGVNTVEVSMNDKADPSIVYNDTWSFNVAEAPKITNMSPANNSEQASLNKVSAVVTDNGAINWDTVQLKINNIVKTPLEINKDTGTVSFANNFSTGSYTAYLEATDSVGKRSTKTWKFIVDSTPPEISSLNYFKDGMTLTDGPLKLSIGLKDLVDIKDNVSLKLDGEPLAIDFKYPGEIDYYGDYVITSRKTATLTYGGMVPNGSHTLELYTEDIFGNQLTRTWNFTAAVKPKISDVSPLKHGLSDLKPTISAVVTSPNGMINADSIVVKVDNEAVDFDFDQSKGLVSYKPTKDLKNESYHTVTITVADQSGISLDREWKFYSNTYKEMDDSSAEACTSCHDDSSFEGSNGVLEDVHKEKLSFNGTHSKNRCENCHNYITVEAGCSQCHDDPEGEQYAHAPHGSTPTIHYQAKNVNPNFPVRVVENRSMNDCIICHQPGSGVKGYQGYLTIPTRTLNNHDIPELHKTEDTCTQCHAKSLTSEHAREDRTDKNNEEMSCKTCHESTDSVVTKAISDGNTSCSSCHKQLHNGVHSDCKKCHTNSY